MQACMVVEKRTAFYFVLFNKKDIYFSVWEHAVASSNYILLIYFNWILIKVNQWFLILILEHIAYLKHCKVVEKKQHFLFFFK